MRFAIFASVAILLAETSKLWKGYMEQVTDASINYQFLFGGRSHSSYPDAILDMGYGYGDYSTPNRHSYGWLCQGIPMTGSQESSQRGGLRAPPRSTYGLNHFDRNSACSGAVEWKVDVPAGSYDVNVTFPEEFKSQCSVQGTNAGCSDSSSCQKSEVVSVGSDGFYIGGTSFNARGCHSVSLVTIQRRQAAGPGGITLEQCKLAYGANPDAYGVHGGSQQRWDAGCMNAAEGKCEYLCRDDAGLKAMGISNGCNSFGGKNAGSGTPSCGHASVHHWGGSCRHANYACAWGFRCYMGTSQRRRVGGCDQGNHLTTTPPPTTPPPTTTTTPPPTTTTTTTTKPPTSIEVGTFAMTTGRKWEVVTFDGAFSEAPVVSVMPTTDGGDPCTIYIKDVTATGFKAAPAEPYNKDGPHPAWNPETISYIAVAPGTFELGGKRVQAGKKDTQIQKYNNAKTSDMSGDGGWDSIGFSGFSDTPALITQIQTVNNEVNFEPDDYAKPFLTVACGVVDTNGASVALERAEVANYAYGRVTTAETIGWIAIEAGTGNFTSASGEEVKYASLYTARVFQGWGTSRSVNFGVNMGTGAPLVIASQNSRHGNNGGWLRLKSRSSTSVTLVVDEDNKVDSERAHVAERAGIFAVSEGFQFP